MVDGRPEAAAKSQASEINPRLADSFPSQSNNQRQQLVDQLLCRVAKLGKRWKNRLSFDNLRFAERYAEGSLEVIVYVRSKRLENANQWAVHYRKDSGLFDVFDIDGVCAFSHSGDFFSGREAAKHRNEDSVLVSDIQHVELPNKVMVPSRVTLQRPDDINSVLTGSLYFSLGKDFHFLRGRFAFADENRKPRFGCGPHAVSDDELAGQEIQGGSEVMDNIADNCSPVRRNGPEHLCLDKMMSCIRVSLGDKSIRTTVHEPGNQWCKVVDVVFGPFDLGVDTDSWVV